MSLKGPLRCLQSLELEVPNDQIGKKHISANLVLGEVSSGLVRKTVHVTLFTKKLSM